MSQAREHLDTDAVHVWFLTDPDARDLARFRAWMTSDEREREARYAFEHSRLEYVRTRALVRATLSRYADVDPADWSFRTNAYGRPEIEHPAAHASLRFNLSNTRGLVALVVARERDVGIDVEDTTREIATRDLEESVFSSRERRALRELPEAARRARFFDHWVLKEAYVKARGLGLSIPLEAFSIVLDGPAIRLEFDPEIDDDPSRWQLARFDLSPTHAAAVVARVAGRGGSFVVRRADLAAERSR